ncbi:hypothetical protein HHE03_15950 [Helicobacter heilmannii]|nr:hypothetical protein HHE03_15950 [Helicobacter heilmannii]
MDLIQVQSFSLEILPKIYGRDLKGHAPKCSQKSPNSPSLTFKIKCQHL